ncbi:MAG: hypothetical protein WC383_06765 [Gammaproteobacteria bacterium]
MDLATLKRLLFPPEPRHFPSQRWLNIALRAVHLIGVAGIGGGFLFALEEERWLAFWYLTVGSGVALSLLYLASSAAWLLQLKGIAIVLKVLLLAAALAAPAWRAELFTLVIVLSALIAHAPGRVRGWTWQSAGRY